MTNRPDFATWNQANLAKFADEAYAKLCEQNDMIQNLQWDVKTAIEAYRTLIKHEAYAKLCEQDDMIQQLQWDLKTAIEAYRALSKQTPESPTCQ